MATSEIFPIFQRTKRPARPASAPVSVQRSAASRNQGAPRSRPTASPHAQRSAGAAQRSRPVREREAGEGNGTRTSSVPNAVSLSNAATVSTRPSASLRPRLRSDNGAVEPAPKTRTPVREAQTASVEAPQLLARSRSAGASRTRQESRNNHPSRVDQGDRPARRFLLRVSIALLLVAFGLFALAFLGVLPARTYFGQQDELVQKKARLVMLGERNGMLGNRVASLQSDQVVARIARDQFGMVAPGDTLTVLPGLRDESLSLNGDASNVVAAVPPADVATDPALLSSLMHWIRQIVG
jgi:cell division protein FtsB